MHVNRRLAPLSAGLLTLTLGFSSPASPALDKAMQAPPASEAPRSAEQSSLTVAALAQAATQYKDAPDDVSWSHYFNAFKEVLASPGFHAADSQLFIQSNRSLSDFRVKVNELGIGKVWSFQLPKESHTALFQSNQGRVFVIPMPQLTALRDAKFLSGAAAAPAKSAGKQPAKPNAAPAKAVGNYLAFIGGDRQNGTLWFKGYKLEGGTLFEAPELFSTLPPFFTQNVTGRASFSGNDIVLTILPPQVTEPAVAKDDIKPEKKAAPVGYKVLLKFAGNHYVISGKLPDDGPQSVAMTFAQSLAANRLEIAKAWLIDPKLISVPKYLGLIGRTTPPMRLVPMSGPNSGGSRYRLVTGTKDDLIIEVGRILQAGRLKGQIAIRALFVAPPDAFAQSIGGSLVLPQVSAPVVSKEPAAGSPEAKAAAAKAKAATQAKKH